VKSPWRTLFFWQASSEVDELKAAGPSRYRWRRGVKNRELVAARVDVIVDMAFSQVVMCCIILTAASVLHASGHTQVQTAQDAASTLAPLAGRFAFVVFATGLIGTGLLSVPVPSGSAAYASLGSPSSSLSASVTSSTDRLRASSAHRRVHRPEDHVAHQRRAQPPSWNTRMPSSPRCKPDRGCGAVNGVLPEAREAARRRGHREGRMSRA
jgi:hypothetical protein